LLLNLLTCSEQLSEDWKRLKLSTPNPTPTKNPSRTTAIRTDRNSTTTTSSENGKVTKPTHSNRRDVPSSPVVSRTRSNQNRKLSNSNGAEVNANSRNNVEDEKVIVPNVLERKVVRKPRTITKNSEMLTTVRPTSGIRKGTISTGKKERDDAHFRLRM
jgi:hypothetical protein